MTEPDILQQQWTEEQVNAKNLGDLQGYYVSSIRVWTSMSAMSNPYWDNAFRLWALSNAHRARLIELRECLASRVAIMRESRITTHA